MKINQYAIKDFLHTALFIVARALLRLLPLSFVFKLIKVPYSMAQNMPANLQCDIYVVVRTRWACVPETFMSQPWYDPAVLLVWLLIVASVSRNRMPRRNGFWRNLKVCILVAVIGVCGLSAVARLYFFFESYTNLIHAQHSLLLLGLAGVAWLWLRYTPPFSESAKIKKQRKNGEPARQRELARTLGIEIAERLDEKASRENRRGQG